MSFEKIKNLIEEIRFKLDKIESFLIDPAKTNVEVDEFEEIKKYLQSEDWPEAVLDFQIVDQDSEEEKMDRAEGIIDILIQEDLDNKKFLDFGCGEGHMAKYASKQSKISVGYDIKVPEKTSFNWDGLDQNFLLTTDFKKVIQNGPYDIIVLYDVLDHAEESFEDVFDKVKSVLSDEGKIYLRCHPWSSRHGSHLYRKINKAFIHLVLSEQEIKNLGFDFEFNKKIIYPLVSYESSIQRSGLKLLNRETETQEVELFFEENDILRNRILNAFEISDWAREGKPIFQMSLCFVDYILSK